MSRKNVLRTLIAVALAVLMLGYMLTYQVRFTEVAVVTTFGRLEPEPVGAGLHFRLPPPVQRVVKYDRRVQHFEDVYEQAQLADGQTLLMSVYVLWQVDDPLRFRANVGPDLTEGENYIRAIVQDAKKSVIGQHTMEHFVSLDASDVRLGQIEQEILANVGPQLAELYGIDVQQVGIRRIGLPEIVSTAVLDNMRKEREEKAQAARSRGKSDAEAIISQAQSIARQIESFARAKAEEIRAQGDAEAAEYYRLYGDDEGFAMFLRRMEFLREALKAKGMFILDGSQWDRSFGWFREPPTVRDVEQDNAPVAQPAEQPAPSVSGR